MQDIKRIVIPVDKSKVSKLAVKEGVFFAKLLGIDAKIISINDTHQFISSVILGERLRKEAESFLEDFKKIVEEFKVNIETEIISGKPAEEIVKYAKEDDLIVMGYHRQRNGIEQYMEKSVSREVVENAPCAVLVVKSK
ncbi:MAG: universal stress protein [Candidatus Thermoplasmatota archaeon]|nr:universal stress protein [Candidatus Thermoplasmatota archaeon]